MIYIKTIGPNPKLNTLLSKENFNSDDQQLYQYQQTHKHLTSKLTEHKHTTTTYDVGNPGPGATKLKNLLKSENILK